jgi:hypothetical protein
MSDAAVVWDVDQATASGDSCGGGDTFFIAAGAEVAVVFTRMNVELVPDQGPNAINHHCRVDIPATIGAGTVVDQLEQQVHFGWALTGGARGSVSARTWFFHRPLPPLEATIDAADPVAAFETLQRTDEIDPPPGFCQSAKRQTTLRLDFRLAGKRQKKSDGITLELQGSDLHYQATMLWASC